MHAETCPEFCTTRVHTDTGRLWEVMDVSVTWTVGVVSQVYVHAPDSPTVCIKYVQFIVSIMPQGRCLETKTKG